MDSLVGVGDAVLEIGNDVVEAALQHTRPLASSERGGCASPNRTTTGSASSPDLHRRRLYKFMAVSFKAQARAVFSSLWRKAAKARRSSGSISTGLRSQS